MESWLEQCFIFLERLCNCKHWIITYDRHPVLKLEFPILYIHYFLLNTVLSGILIVPFLVCEDVKDNMEWGTNNKWVEKVFFAMVKTELCLTGDRKFGLWGRGGLKKQSMCLIYVIPSPVQTCDIPLGEVPVAVLQCGLTNSWSWDRYVSFFLTMSIHLSVLQSCLIGYPNNRISKIWFIWDLRGNCNSLLIVLVRASWMTSQWCASIFWK